MSVNNLGVLYFELRDTSTALEFGQRALKGRVQVLGEEHLDTIMTRDNVAVALQSMSKYGEA